ncbi:GNAT family N-acetyltransferase [Haloarchaeobius amylolyticus]|uniref:GNAT family N-acetyltransferase n=1 Tax=Haloarchaeobius amylolyticus TaxID=1198296 RepID=UPI00226EBC66|nr:GNAT family protein [Haloarchaeobius amylolyticus]
MTDHAFLTDGRVSLRPIEPDDLPALRAGWNDPAVWRMLDTVEPQSPGSFERMVEGWQDDDRHVPFAIDADGLVGLLQVKRIHWQSRICTFSYFVLPDATGDGYATAAVELGLEYAFDSLGLHRVQAKTIALNEGSQRVLEKAGFTHEGTARRQAYVDGSYHDLLSWGLLDEEWRERREG